MSTIAAAADFVGLMIGRPYEPAGLHCWELVRTAQKLLFDRDLPPVLVAPERRRELVGLMSLRHSYSGWGEIPDAQHGAVVFMTRHGHDLAQAACHAGVWLALDGGGVLHTDDPHGVVFDSLPELAARNWGELGFFVPTEPTA